MMEEGKKVKLFGLSFGREWGKLKRETRKKKELISNE